MMPTLGYCTGCGDEAPVGREHCRDAPVVPYAHEADPDEAYERRRDEQRELDRLDGLP